MTPGLFPVDSARYKKLIMPVFVFLICFQLFLLQIIFTIEDGKANKTVNQEKDANSSIALAASSPEQQASTNQPKASLTSDKAAVPTANPVPSSPEQQVSTNQPETSQTPDKAEVPTANPVPPVPREEILRSVPAAGKRVALTFDDGPSSRYTLEYLRVLREHQVPATFFLIGSKIESNPVLASAIAGDGHEIGNHTYSHPNLKQQNETVIKEQISRTSDLITRWTSQKEVSLFRPPGGNYGPGLIKVASEMNLRVVMWRIDPRDWEKNKTASEIIAIVKKNLEPGAIILLHEGKPQTLAALPILITDLRNDGWDFVTVSQLIGETNESI